jgi:hypothetical protein
MELRNWGSGLRFAAQTAISWRPRSSSNIWREQRITENRKSANNSGASKPDGGDLWWIWIARKVGLL